MRPAGEIAAKLGIPDDALHQYGKYKAKVDYTEAMKGRDVTDHPVPEAPAQVVS